jgi:predicted dithiol-disulfide oxidoreductase (DUF899 family)
VGLGSYIVNAQGVEKLEAFKKRMGWSFKWVSSGNTDFNFDYHVSLDIMNTAYHYLDLVPKGRDEAGLEYSQAWVHYHDKYEDRPSPGL